MLIQTNLGDIEDNLIEKRIVREQEHDGNKSVEIRYYFNNEPIQMQNADGSFSAGELNLYPKQLQFAQEQGKIGI